MVKTKIVATLGPASDSEHMLKRMIAAGVNVFRLNFSHGTLLEHGQEIKRIRQVARAMNQNVAVMQDLRGPKIRLGMLGQAQVLLKTGAVVRMFSGQKSSQDNMLPVSYPRLTEEVKKGDRILLGDGEIELRVLGIDAGKLVCKVVVGGTTASKKGVNLPSERLSISAITDKDRRDLAFGVQAGVDYVALSFVREARHIDQLRRMIKRAGAEIPIIAKIESFQALKNIDEIIQAADGVMVARGDLGVEVPLEEVPPLQKMIIRKANLCARPVITATQMLKSMVENKRPTRAEVTDVANAIYDGTDAVMLSEETTIGKYPVEAVKTMRRIAREAEKHWEGCKGIKTFDFVHTRSIPEAISHAAARMSEEMQVKAIITPTRTGLTARLVSRFKPKVPILAISPHQDTVKRLALVWGVEARYIPDMEKSHDLLETACKCGRRFLGLKPGELVVITGGLPISAPGTTNVVQVREIN